MRLMRLGLLVHLSPLIKLSLSTPPEPYPALNGYNATAGPARPHSPDPLVRYHFDSGTNLTQLQEYTVSHPVSVTADPPGAFSGLDSLLKGAANLTVKGSGRILLDFGVERAAWLEFESPDLVAAGYSNESVFLSISEYNEPYKTMNPQSYGDFYRLETNSELYEGVRFAWISFNQPANHQSHWHITQVRLVAKVKAVNYTGYFEAQDKTLEAVWYTGAYAVRLNMEADGFNSILIDRGDRVSIQGDGHPTMAAALVAFSPFELVADMINATDSGSVHGHSVVDSGIMAYPMYWTMSVNDWYWASGNTSGFLYLVPDVQSILDARIKDFGSNPQIVWMGWDDRIGNGWCGNCNGEAQAAFAALVIRACLDFSRSLRQAGQTQLAEKYNSTAYNLTTQLINGRKDWYSALGLHASANVINAGIIASDAETEKMFSLNFNDSVTICSWSPFNQYWILQALGNANKMEHALASIRLCWGEMIQLGKGCFWELFSPEWADILSSGDKAPTRPSYCHPWSSGVTAWITHRLLGVSPIKPGYEEVLVMPHVSLSNQHMAGRVQSPFGPINTKVSWDQSSSSLSITVDSPRKGQIAIASLLHGSCALNLSTVRLRTNGSKSWMPPSMLRHSSDFARLPRRVVEEHLFYRIPAGFSRLISSFTCGSPALVVPVTTETETEFTGIPHFPPFPVPEYPAASSVDLSTQGNWTQDYGKEGYALFGFENSTADLLSLPQYVRNVSVTTHGFYGTSNVTREFVGCSSSNTSFLVDPRPRHQGERALGACYDTGDGSQGILLSINVTSNAFYKASAYFFNIGPAARLSVRVLDGESLNVVAPAPLIEFNRTQGVWLSVTYNRSLVLRIESITPAASVSAVMFDKP